MRFLFSIILATILAVLGCAEKSVVDVGTAQTQEHPMIFGADDRLDIYEAPEPWKTIGMSSVMAIISPHAINATGGGLEIGRATLGEAYQLCEGERFADQPVAAQCSAILIDKDLVLTAGHCIETCGNLKFAFSYFQDDADTTHETTLDEIYACSEILVRAFDDRNIDYAVVKLSREVVGFEPVYVPKVRPTMQPGDPLTMIGFPNGLPMKVEANGLVRDPRTALSDAFDAQLDSFSGNSGSGVMNADGEVVGILARGYQSYWLDGDCTRVQIYPENDQWAAEVAYADLAIQELCDDLQYPSEFLCDIVPACGDGFCTNGETPWGCEEDCNEDAWFCDARLYDDGDECDCGCGTYDFDCDFPENPIRGCIPGEQCNDSGYCYRPDADAPSTGSGDDEEDPSTGSGDDEEDPSTGSGNDDGDPSASSGNDDEDSGCAQTQTQVEFGVLLLFGLFVRRREPLFRDTVPWDTGPKDTVIS